MPATSSYDPIFTEELAPWIPDSGSRPGREVRLLGGMLLTGKQIASLKRRMTPVAVVIIILLVLWPTLHSLFAPLYSETCSAQTSKTLETVTTAKLLSNDAIFEIGDTIVLKKEVLASGQRFPMGTRGEVIAAGPNAVNVKVEGGGTVLLAGSMILKASTTTKPLEAVTTVTATTAVPTNSADTGRERTTLPATSEVADATPNGMIPSMQMVTSQACRTYAMYPGCGWTFNWSCPGQSDGEQGKAVNDGSHGYACCCLDRLWRQAADSRLTAYEAFEHCAPHGLSQHTDWCPRLAAFERIGDVGSMQHLTIPFSCQEVVSTALCDSGLAELVKLGGSMATADIIKHPPLNVTIEGCLYAYYAQYRCVEMAMQPRRAFLQSSSSAESFNDASYTTDGRDLRRQLKERNHTYVSKTDKDNQWTHASHQQRKAPLEREACTLEGRSMITLLSALLLVLLLKISTVKNAKDLIGSTDAAKREGLGGVFFRLVALWNFWGPACALAVTIVRFQGSFTGNWFETVHNVTSGSYYIVEHPANLTDPGLFTDCAAFSDYGDVRQFSRIALGAGAILTFTIGSLFFGLGELFKIDILKGFILEEQVNFDFVEYFHSCWRSDKLLDGYDSMISSFHDWKDKHQEDFDMIGKTLEGLESGALESLAGPAKRFEELGKERLVGRCRYMLEPLFLEKGGLKWDEALVVLKKVSITGLVEKGPHAWFEETWEYSIPVLKSLTLQKLQVLQQVKGWLVEQGVEWDEIWPILDESVTLETLRGAVDDPTTFLHDLANVGPIAMKCAVGSLRKIPAVSDVLAKEGIQSEDAVRVFQKLSLEDLHTWVEKITSAEKAASDLSAFLDKAPGSVGRMWEIAKLRPKIGKSLQEKGIAWDDAVHVLESASSVEDLHSASANIDALETRFDLPWKIAKSRACLEPELKKRGLGWPMMREILESSANSADLDDVSANPGRFLDNLDDWKKRKQEEAEQQQRDDANIAVNNIEQLKVIWPALCQCVATSLWLGTSYVDTHPCVAFDGGSSIFGFLPWHPGTPYVHLLIYVDYVMIACVLLGLGIEVLAMKHKWKSMEKKGPLAIAGILVAYLVGMAHFSSAKQGKGASAFLKTAASGAAENFKSAPIGTVMSVGYITEAGARVTASKISPPSVQEQTAYTEHRNRLIERKAKELREVAPPELKDKVNKLVVELEEAKKEGDRRRREKENAEEEERKRREAEARFLQEQEAAARAEEEKRRRAEEEERRKREEEERRKAAEEEAKRKQEEEARQKVLEEQRRLAELLQQGAEIDLNLPFKQNFSKIEQPELWKEELDRVTAAVKELDRLNKATGHTGPALVLLIQVTTLGKPDVKGMDGLLERRAQTIKRELIDRGLPEEDLRIGLPRYEDPPPRGIVRAVKPGEEEETQRASQEGREAKEAKEPGESSKSKSEKSKKPKK